MKARREAEKRAVIDKAPTFGKMADDYIAGRNTKYANQWTYTLKTLAAPLRQKRVS